MTRGRFWTAALLGMALTTGLAQADDAEPWQGHMMGPGMMGGQGTMGPGMMGTPPPRGYNRRGGPGYGPGMGMMGPGMQGYGPGMGMMGPGMQGYGPGAGGPGYGQGTGGFNPWAADLNLSQDQSRTISRILEQTRAKNWQTQGQMADAVNALRQAYDAPKPDPAEVGEAYEEVLRFQKEMVVDNVEAQNRIYELLNEQQREQWRRGAYGGRQW
ncbi:MAG TPA: Spy/CpxP family protein refolding chaperone [Gammaproteobacteria bacterium]|nr:Spy/CpxP family protein refolding chaperone [Gammaproteobacteria bacterium]